jgi:TP53 regulating kinase-like protein
MIYKDEDIYLLDFGLGALTATVEDKAVDLYLFEKAFIATHPHLEKVFKKVLEEYGEISVIQRLEQVRQRGRKKVNFG